MGKNSLLNREKPKACFPEGHNEATVKRWTLMGGGFSPEFFSAAHEVRREKWLLLAAKPVPLVSEETLS